MTIPLSSTNITDYSGRLLSSLKSARTVILRAQSELATDNYGTLINIPSHNKQIQDQITEIKASDYTDRIVADLNQALPSDVTVADITNFANALDGFATIIEANAALFIVSINATNKRTEFVTPMADNIKTAITNNINAVLAEIS